MAKIPFDIKYRNKIESGEYKLETECGHPVSIMDWEWIDRNEKKCLAVKVLMDEGFNIGYLFDYDGKRHSIFPSDSDSDLFIVTPEEELTEWQRFISACLQKHGLLDCGAADRIAKESAAELLSLAREQFIKDGYVIEKKAFHDAVENISDKHLAEMSVQYTLHCKIEDGTRHAVMNWPEFQKLAQKFIDIGKAEALRDLPRWKKWENGGCGRYELPLAIVHQHGSYKLVNVLGTQGEKYIMLSDLEKLPGFKED